MTTQKSMRKAAQRALVMDRLTRAMDDIYGNARISKWPTVESEFSVPFFDWLGEYATRELEYMSTDNFGLTLNETRAPNFYHNARQRLETARQRNATVRDAATAEMVRRVSPSWILADARNRYSFPNGPFERERANLIRNAAQWLTREEKSQRTGQYYRAPAIYSHGRNGKTFYPDQFADSGNSGFRARDVDGMPYAKRAELAQFIEQFNLHIRSLADNAAATYVEETREALQEKAAEARATIRRMRESFHALRVESKGVPFGPNIRAQIREALCDCARMVRKAARDLSRINSDLAQMAGGAK